MYSPSLAIRGIVGVDSRSSLILFYVDVVSSE